MSDELRKLIEDGMPEKPSPWWCIHADPIKDDEGGSICPRCGAAWKEPTLHDSLLALEWTIWKESRTLPPPGWDRP